MQCEKINLLKFCLIRWSPDNYRTVKSGASIADFKRSGAGKLLVLDILLWWPSFDYSAMETVLNRHKYSICRYCWNMCHANFSAGKTADIAAKNSDFAQIQNAWFVVGIIRYHFDLDFIRTGTGDNFQPFDDNSAKLVCQRINSRRRRNTVWYVGASDRPMFCKMFRL